jgi:tetratricopeptide (TPR) repeat protein
MKITNGACGVRLARFARELQRRSAMPLSKLFAAGEKQPAVSADFETRSLVVPAIRPGADNRTAGSAHGCVGLSRLVGLIPVISLLLLLWATPAWAAFDDLGAGARAAGMGNAFVPVADDVYTIYYNPAGLGTLERPELGTAYSLMYPGLTDGSNLNTSFVGYVQPLKEGKYGTLGLAWNSFSLNTSLYREDAFYLSYGKALYSSTAHGDLYGGVNLKYLSSTFGSFPEASNAVPTNGVLGQGAPDPLLSGNHAQTAYDTDLGLLYRPDKHFSLGFSAIHLNQPNVSFSGNAVDRLPMIFKAGFNYRSLISNLVAEFDSQQTPAVGRDNTFTLGAERWFPQTFAGDVAARMAVGFGSREYKEIDAGLSYRTHRFEIDYALGIPIGTVDVPISSHKISLSFRFGRRTEQEESLEMVLEAMKQLKAGQSTGLAPKAVNVSRAEKATIDEYLMMVRGLEARAQYYDALQKFNDALQVAPADKDILDRYGRLSFVGQQIKSLPDYKSDPLQASLHLGLLAYIHGYNLEAVEKVSYALSLRPQWKELDAFLTQMETITGIKRTLFPNRKRGDEQAAIKLAQANAAIEDGYDEEAVTLSLEVLRIEPKNAAAWEDLGTAYFALKRYDDSLKAWQKAEEYESNPAVRAAIKQTMASIRRARDHAAAIAKPATPAPAAVVPSVPERPYMSVQEKQDLFDQAVDHYTRREFQQAKELLEKILASDPDNVEAQKALRRVKDELP